MYYKSNAHTELYSPTWQTVLLSVKTSAWQAGQFPIHRVLGKVTNKATAAFLKVINERYWTYPTKTKQIFREMVASKKLIMCQPLKLQYNGR